jgi:hypothetical protein
MSVAITADEEVERDSGNTPSARMIFAVTCAMR